MRDVECTSKFEIEPGQERLTTSVELTQWIRDLPADAHLTAVTREMGSQRDPWTVLVGLRAKWSEVR